MGSIMPDAVEICNKDKSHFKVETDTLKYLDFVAYRTLYRDLMLRDDLYLGYYIHLVVDAFYRSYIYQNCFTMPQTREEVALLHHDYHILNAYIVNKYNIHNILEKEHSFSYEPINDIATFLIEDSLCKLSDEFVEQPQGATNFLTEHMLDEFIKTYIPLAIDEIRNLKNGTSTLRPIAYAWQHNK